jgi:thioredoxin 1
MFAPIFEAAAEKNPGILFGKVDTEAEEELASMFGIRSIPTLFAFKKGVPVFNQPGMLPAEALENLIGKIQELQLPEEAIQEHRGLLEKSFAPESAS